MDSEETVVRGIITLPTEYLEKILIDPPRRNENSLLDGLVCAPRIIMSLLQSMPMPWEESKAVSCTYNTDGLVLECKSLHTEDSIDYVCKWLYTIEGIRTGTTYSVKERRYTMGEYRKLREGYPMAEVSCRAEKEDLFPFMYQQSRARNNLRDGRKSEEMCYNSIQRQIIPRENARIIINSHMRRSKPVKKRAKDTKACDTSRNKDESAGNSSRYKPPKKEYRSTMEWMKFAKIYLAVGRRLLRYVIKERKMGYVEVSDRYDLDRKRELKTKEKKKSRMGQTFHIVKELFKLLSRVVSILERKASKELTAAESMKLLFKEFSCVGVHTAIYRYKYSTIRQISESSRVSKLLKFYKNQTGNCYDLLWCEPWRVWVLFLQGVSPLLVQRLEQYALRRREGRRKREKKVTSQRAKSDADIQFKKKIVEKIEGVAKINQAQMQLIVNLLKTAWKQWKSEGDYVAEIKTKVTQKSFSGLLEDSVVSLQSILILGIEERGMCWARETVTLWNKHAECKIKNKKEIKKIKSRILRASMIVNKKIQRIAIEQEIKKGCEKNILKDSLIAQSLDEQSHETVLTLSLYDNSTLLDILAASLNRLASTYKRHLKQEEKKELERITACKGVLENTLAVILKKIAKKKDSVTISIDYSAQEIAYHYPVDERMCDSFLDHLIAYHFAQTNIQNCTLPLDSEPLPCTLSKHSEEMREVLANAFTLEGKRAPVYFTSIDYSHLADEIGRNTLKSHLNEQIDPVITDYIMNRLSSTLEYKDIATVQRVGVCRGLEFYSSLAECILMKMDRRIRENGKENVLKYFRCGSVSYILHREELFGAAESVFSRGKLPADSYIRSKLLESSLYNVLSSAHPLTRCMAKLPVHFFSSHESCKENELDLRSDIYSCNVETITLPVVLCHRIDSFPSLLPMHDFNILLSADRSYLQSSKNSLKTFQSNFMKIYFDAAGTSFFVISDRWNRLLMQTVLFFRETLTDEFIDFIRVSEEKLKKRIMSTVNTQIKKRFPNVLFYAGKEHGGLNLLSSLVLIKSVRSWKEEIELSISAYDKIFRALERIPPEHRANAIHPIVKELHSEGVNIKETGIPRISAFIHKPKVYHVETHWRLRNYFTSGNRRWTSEEHDGFWMPWTKYKAFLSQTNAYALNHSAISLRKKSNALKIYSGNLHRVIRQKWNVLPSTTEDDFLALDPTNSNSVICHTTVKEGKTRAQLSDAARLPNRMFMLWWSPVINRGRINVGHPSAVEATGILLTGKIASLRISYTKIFSDGLWLKIKQEIVALTANVLEKGILQYGITSIDIKKSNIRTSDDPLPSLLFDVRNPAMCSAWVLVCLRWGNIDSCSVEEECAYYCTEMINTASNYSHSNYGCVVLADLQQCKYSVKATDSTLAEIAHLIDTGLLYNIHSLNSLCILKTRVAKAVGYSSSKDEEAVSDPRAMFKHENALFVQISSSAAAGINIRTGEYFKYEYKSGTKLHSIVKRLYDLLIEHKVQYIYAPLKEYSLLSKSGISYCLIKTSIAMEIVRLPNSATNAYKAWPETKPYTALCRLAIILRHSVLYETDAADLISRTASDLEWIEIENRLMLEICQAVASKMGVSGDLFLPSATAHKVLQDIVYSVHNENVFTNTSVSRLWTNMTNWRDRYQLVDSGNALQKLQKSMASLRSTCNNTPVEMNSDLGIADRSSNSFTIAQDILAHLIHISDPLVPVVGFVCGALSAYFVTPRQLFSSRNFFISPFDVEAYPIAAIVHTATPFSHGMVFTYSGICIPSAIPVISIDLATGVCSGHLCVPESIGDTISMRQKDPLVIAYTDKKSSFLSATGWNRNIVEEETPLALVPEKPLPFYSEEFRKSHFQRT
ncbi:pre-mRNA-processing factor 8 [Nematocida minor]|uniref:pre-mRNA-processing factor 8 n=1 Tax=Nematocida minor TaxID=1912983 RepID=UPI0022208A95|nr:pre-mRNA-processing factor 8 [Nematocida minor]KAI5189655.1 pre-mRNA-processing factor 8 [Nematocida minor]